MRDNIVRRKSNFVIVGCDSKEINAIQENGKGHKS